MDKAGPIVSTSDGQNKSRNLFYFKNSGIQLDDPKLLQLYHNVNEIG